MATHSSSEAGDPSGLEPTEAGSAFNPLQVALRHKSLLALGGVVGLVLGALYYAQRTPVYQSSAQLIVIKKQGNPLPTGDADPRAYFYEDYLATHQVLIKSPIIVQRAVQKHNLRRLRAFQGQGDPSGAIRGSLVVLRDGKDLTAPSNVLNLAFSCSVSEDAPVVLDAVIASYKDYLDEQYKNVSDSTLAQIIQAMESLRKELSEKKKAYAAFQENSPLVYGGKAGTEGSSLQEEWLGHIQAKRLTLKLQKAELQGRLDMIQQALKEGRGRAALLAQITASAVRGSTSGTHEAKLHEQMFELMLKEQVLLADYGQDHPEVRSVRQRMALTRDFFARGADNSKAGNPLAIDPVEWHVNGLRQEVADLDTSLAALDQLSDKEQINVRDVQKYKTTDRAFREDIGRLQALFEPIIRRLEEIKLIRELGGFDAQVIAPPLPGGRTGTGAIQIILFGTILGLCGGFGLGYLAEVTDKSFRTPEEIRTRLGLPVVGHVPVLDGDPSAATPVGDEGVLLDPFLCTYFRSKSTQAEAFRGVRTALYFSTRGEVHKVIQVTSPNASDGKSTVAANLAICIAQSGKRILLIDADLRKPRQHKVFGLQPKVGLASVIAGEAEWKDAVHATPVPGLSLMPCGPHPQNPAELLTQPRFKELLDALREEYDFVLIDTPPLLAVSDPSVVAPRADGVLLVVRVSKNGRPSAERARDILRTLGVRVLGVIVNGAGDRGSGYGYDSGEYGYGSRYNYYSYGDQSYYQDDEELAPEVPETGAPSATAAGPESAPRATLRPHQRRVSHRPPPSALQRFLTWWQS